MCQAAGPECAVVVMSDGDNGRGGRRGNRGCEVVGVGVGVVVVNGQDDPLCRLPRQGTDGGWLGRGLRGVCGMAKDEPCFRFDRRHVT